MHGMLQTGFCVCMAAEMISQWLLLTSKRFRIVCYAAQVADTFSAAAAAAAAAATAAAAGDVAQRELTLPSAVIGRVVDGVDAMA
jgi:hypothetical protein